jgi:hypothetical protein
MSTDLQRAAATNMRNQHGPEHVRHDFWSALADWLDDVATDIEHDLWPEGHDVPRHSLVVARAYLLAKSWPSPNA